MAGVDRLKRSGKDPKYIHEAARWLRENRFLDTYGEEDGGGRELTAAELGGEGRGPWCVDWTAEEAAEWDEHHRTRKKEDT